MINYYHILRTEDGFKNSAAALPEIRKKSTNIKKPEPTTQPPLLKSTSFQYTK